MEDKMTSRNTYVGNLLKLLSRFDVESIQDLMPEIFPSQSFDEIKYFCQENKLPLSSSVVADLLTRLFFTKSPSSDDIFFTLLKLHLNDVILRKQNVWRIVKLIDKNEDLPSNIMALKKCLLQQYRMKALNAVIYILSYLDIIWVAMAEKKITKSKGIKFCAPQFFAFKPDMENNLHVLYNPVNLNSNYLKMFVNSVGYNDYETIDCKMRDPEQIFSLMARRMNEENRIIPTYNCGALQTISSTFTISGSYMNRLKIASLLSEPVTPLREILVENEGEWAGGKADESSDSLVQSAITFKNKNGSVQDLFLYMIKIGAVKQPLPQYIVDLPMTLANRIQIP